MKILTFFVLLVTPIFAERLWLNPESQTERDFIRIGIKNVSKLSSTNLIRYEIELQNIKKSQMLTGKIFLYGKHSNINLNPYSEQLLNTDYVRNISTKIELNSSKYIVFDIPAQENNNVVFEIKYYLNEYDHFSTLTVSNIEILVKPN